MLPPLLPLWPLSFCHTWLSCVCLARIHPPTYIVRYVGHPCEHFGASLISRGAQVCNEHALVAWALQVHHRHQQPAYRHGVAATNARCVLSKSFAVKCLFILSSSISYVNVSLLTHALHNLSSFFLLSFFLSSFLSFSLFISCFM